MQQHVKTRRVALYRAGLIPIVIITHCGINSYLFGAALRYVHVCLVCDVACFRFFVVCCVDPFKLLLGFFVYSLTTGCSFFVF